MQLKILLVGAGELGSRHLQALVKCNISSDIYIVDPSAKSLKIAETRSTEVEHESSHNLHFFDSLSLIQEERFDYFVLATSSNNRLDILLEILKKFQIKTAILEKFLFQELDAYEILSKFLEDLKTEIYINCPFRSFKFYKRVKDSFNKINEPIIISLKGGTDVGMACNAIHYIDLLYYLSDDQIFKIITDELDDGYIKSKREGYIEFTGKMKCLFKKNSELIVESKNIERNIDKILTITKGNAQYVINETKFSFSYTIDGILVDEGYFDFERQSDLTHKFIIEHLQSGRSNLPSYSISKEQHLECLKSFIRHLNKISSDIVKKVPIT